MLFNAGCERLTGWTADEVLGTTCEYDTSAAADTVARLCGALCPPPEVFTGKTAHVPAAITTRNGSSLSRMLHFHPILEEDGSLAFIFGTIREIDSKPSAHRVPVSQQLHAELSALRSAVRSRYGSDRLLGQSPVMQRVLAQFVVARDADAAVLLVGENGTGKEHLARAIHNDGPRRLNAFVPIECAGLPPRELRRTLRELFDTLAETDATAAPAMRPGTLYLKDVDALQTDAQDLILAEIPDADLRLIAGTANAESSVSLKMEFRLHVSTLRIDLPALRNRTEDFPLLAQAFLERLNRGSERQVVGFADDVWEQLREYRWPGNLDELDAVVHEARATAKGDLIEVADLPFRFRTGLDAQTVGPPIEPNEEPLDDYLARLETERIQEVLQQTKQNKAKAAILLGLTRPKLYRRMESLGISDVEDE